MQLANAPEAQLDGILVQPMVSGLAEVLVGYRRDPETGPIVVLGIGGVLAELYGDAAVRPAPVDATMAHEMIREVRGLLPFEDTEICQEETLMRSQKWWPLSPDWLVLNAPVFWKRNQSALCRQDR